MNSFACKLYDTLKNLLEQERRQIDMETCEMWGSYPETFPQWNKAWEQARKIAKEAEKILSGEEREKCITVEIKGGMLIDVRDLPSGYTYQLIDWDLCPECGGRSCDFCEQLNN